MRVKDLEAVLGKHPPVSQDLLIDIVFHCNSDCHWEFVSNSCGAMCAIPPYCDFRIVPFGILYVLDYLSLSWGITSTTITWLQSGLLRRYLSLVATLMPAGQPCICQIFECWVPRLFQWRRNWPWHVQRSQEASSCQPRNYSRAAQTITDPAVISVAFHQDSKALAQAWSPAEYVHAAFPNWKAKRPQLSATQVVVRILMFLSCLPARRSLAHPGQFASMPRKFARPKQSCPI